MKRILKFLLSLIMFAFITIVHAEGFNYHYSEWSEEYPQNVDEIAIESEDRYLCYREWYLDNGELVREETTEYFASLMGFDIIESTKKTFYRYITDEYVVINGSGNIVYSSAYCIKNSCFNKYIKKEPPLEEPPKEETVVEVKNNPKTYDNIFVYLIVAFISLVSAIIVISSKKKTEFVETA